MIDSFEAMVHLIYGVTDTDDTGDEKNKVISEAKSMRFYFNNLNGDFESHNLLLDDFDLKLIKSKTIGFGEILPNQVLTDSYLQRKIFTTARMPDVVELVRRTI